MLRRARSSLGLTAVAVSKGTGVPAIEISRLERDVLKQPSAEHLAQLADFYRIPRSEVFAMAGYKRLAEGSKTIILFEGEEVPSSDVALIRELRQLLQRARVS